jgi:hypothetical protein
VTFRSLIGPVGSPSELNALIRRDFPAGEPAERALQLGEDSLMRATVMCSAGDARVESIPDAATVEPTDAVVRVTRARVCGDNLWPCDLRGPVGPAQRMGREATTRP